MGATLGRLTGRIDIRATALEPIVHGAGTSGNTSVLRTQAIQLEDGSLAEVPFVSGNSIKHRLRASAVQYALDALGVEDGTLTKAEVDLLFSGGHLSKTGAAVDLRTARKLEELFPPLSLCGYSAGNTMTESKLRVSHLHLVCIENRWRLPDDLVGHPASAVRCGALRSEEFGTRHDQGTKATGARYLTSERRELLDGKKSAAITRKGAAEKDSDSAQMIYEYQAIAAGATLWGSVQFVAITEMERAALSSAFHYASSERRGKDYMISIGAKNSTGYGSIRAELRGEIRIASPEFAPDTTALANPQDTIASQYVDGLRARREEILAAVREAAR